MQQGVLLPTINHIADPALAGIDVVPAYLWCEIMARFQTRKSSRNTLNFQVKGIKQIERKLRRLQREAVKAAGDAVKAEAEEILEKARSEAAKI